MTVLHDSFYSTNNTGAHAYMGPVGIYFSSETATRHECSKEEITYLFHSGYVFFFNIFLLLLDLKSILYFMTADIIQDTRQPVLVGDSWRI